MKGLRYLSVCSGIEAASVAWHPLGWQPFAFSQFDPDHDYKNGPDFPSALLAFRYPHVPNLGDMTKFKEWPDAAIDLLVGGTPCQSFSVAGLRKGLADPRGNLALTFLAIADRYRPEWIVWENVPGVLSSTSYDAPDPCPPPAPVEMERDGQEMVTDDEFDSEELHALNSILAGFSELGYGWALRVLDAQYVRVDGFGRAVPQRRRRVIVVGNSRDWRRSAAVLFEPESLQGHTPPRRQAGQGPAGGARVRTAVSSGQGWWDDSDVGATIRSQDSINKADTLIAFGDNNRQDGSSGGAPGTGIGKAGDPSPTVASSHVPAIAFDCKAGAKTGFAIGDLPGPLRGEGHGGGHAAIAFDLRNGTEDDVSQTLQAAGIGTERGGNPNAMPHTLHGIGHNSAGGPATWAVRRLMPIECERLQGFPDGYTLIPFRGKPASDGVRYKSLGNSMAVNVMRWLGRRIDMVRGLVDELDLDAGESAQTSELGYP